VHVDFFISAIPVQACEVADIGARMQMSGLCFKY